MFKLHYYIFKFFFTIFLAVLFSIIALVGFSDFIFNYKPSIHSLSWLVENIIRSSIFSLEISIPLSFIASFCFFNIKFSKSFELNATRTLGISHTQLIKPIFYFSYFKLLFFLIKFFWKKNKNIRLCFSFGIDNFISTNQPIGRKIVIIFK